MGCCKGMPFANSCSNGWRVSIPGSAEQLLLNALLARGNPTTLFIKSNRLGSGQKGMMSKMAPMQIHMALLQLHILMRFRWKQQYVNTLGTERATGRDLLNALLVKCCDHLFAWSNPNSKTNLGSLQTPLKATCIKRTIAVSAILLQMK
ncbi:hypothetical protein WJX84_011108 [Apatococcus fuscideae]|uniref:Uncharacterized protein n=1 Tax=Apatococcus fuscideae TaxID=2026836 RepID=A0AAW1TGC8_9CHLO